MIYTSVVSKLPSVMQKPYHFIKSFMVSMGSPPAPTEQQMQDPSLANIMAQAFRRCEIF
jgi:hypothetical protein